MNLFNFFFHCSNTDVYDRVRPAVCTQPVHLGQNTAAVVESILTGYKVEQQGYRACMALLKLSDQYSPERLEAACIKAFSYMPRPSYKAIQAILKTGQDKITDESAAPSESDEFGFIRGSDYYGSIHGHQTSLEREEGDGDNA